MIKHNQNKMGAMHNIKSNKKRIKILYMEKKEKDTRKLKLKSILISEPIPLPEIIKML